MFLRLGLVRAEQQPTSCRTDPQRGNALSRDNCRMPARVQGNDPGHVRKSTLCVHDLVMAWQGIVLIASRIVDSVKSIGKLAETKFAINFETITHAPIFGTAILTGLAGVGIDPIVGRHGLQLPAGFPGVGISRFPTAMAKTSITRTTQSTMVTTPSLLQKSTPTKRRPLPKALPR